MRILLKKVSALAVVTFATVFAVNGYADQLLDEQVSALFGKNCADCHGLKQTKYSTPKKPHLDSTSDLLSLRNNPDYVIAGDAADSPLFKRVILPADNEDRMPKFTGKEKREPLTTGEITVLRRWIEQESNVTKRKFVTDRLVVEAILSNLNVATEKDRQFYRYLTLHNLYNAGDSDFNLEIYRAALSKLVNSLSIQAKIIRPQPIDPLRLVLRIDLRNYGWSAEKWELLARGYPYAILLGLRIEREVSDFTGSSQAFLRGDWFVFAASQPPLYNELLNLPETDSKLEESLGITVADNLRMGLAKRSGFVKSGVSDFNRIIERHPMLSGAYWKSYDFRSNNGDQDIFQNPLGPQLLGYRFAFKQAGGEIIYSLPNGLQAYLLAKADGGVIARAPIDIVHDPERTDSAIINGISCMRCHAEGMRSKPSGDLNDDLRATAFRALELTSDERQLINAMYPDASKLAAFYNQDSQRFKAALGETGAGITPEPVSFLYDRFRRDITAATFPSEFGLESDNIQHRLEESDLQDLRAVGAKIKQASVFPRKNFIEQFRQTVEGLQLGRLREVEPVRHEEFFPSAGGNVAPELLHQASAKPVGVGGNGDTNQAILAQPLIFMAGYVASIFDGNSPKISFVIGGLLAVIVILIVLCIRFKRTRIIQISLIMLALAIGRILFLGWNANTIISISPACILTFVAVLADLLRVKGKSLGCLVLLVWLVLLVYAIASFLLQVSE